MCTFQKCIFRVREFAADNSGDEHGSRNCGGRFKSSSWTRYLRPPIPRASLFCVHTKVASIAPKFCTQHLREILKRSAFEHRAFRACALDNLMRGRSRSGGGIATPCFPVARTTSYAGSRCVSLTSLLSPLAELWPRLSGAPSCQFGATSRLGAFSAHATSLPVLITLQQQ